LEKVFSNFSLQSTISVGFGHRIHGKALSTAAYVASCAVLQRKRTFSFGSWLAAGLLKARMLTTWKNY